jgi:hypothetical protein
MYIKIVGVQSRNKCSLGNVRTYSHHMYGLKIGYAMSILRKIVLFLVHMQVVKCFANNFPTRSGSNCQLFVFKLDNFSDAFDFGRF